MHCFAANNKELLVLQFTGKLEDVKEFAHQLAVAVQSNEQADIYYS
jgi:hypothetical protein